MKLSHMTESGDASMVDVSGKPDRRRMATASGEIMLSPDTMALINRGGIGKGNVLAVARIAGIQAAKKTSDLIPLCHNVELTHVEIGFETGADRIIATAAAKSAGKTGVEMESLSAVSVALLSIYDMCKAVDKGMRITDIKLLSKEKEGPAGE